MKLLGKRTAAALSLAITAGIITAALPKAQAQSANGYFSYIFDPVGVAAALFGNEVKANNNALLATETWSGQAGDNNWSSNLNWDGVGGAGADDDLVFPLEPLGGFPSHNDFANGTRFRSILIQGGGYAITGNRILLTAGLSSTETSSQDPSFAPNITLDANQTFNSTSGDLDLNGAINLGGHTLNVSTGSQNNIFFNGDFNGTGNLNLAGNATIIGNASTFGPTEIDSHRLSVNSPGVLGSVNLNGGALQGTGTVGAITANAANGGDIRPGLNNGSQAGSTGILTTTGASVLNAATTLEIHMFGATAGTQLDQLRVSGNNINLGGADLDLIVGFTPIIGQQFTIVSQQGAGDLTGQFAQGSTVNSGGQIFTITYTVNGVVLTYQGTTLVWDGSSSSSWSTAANWDVNIAPAGGSAGTDLIFPAGAQNLNNSNNVGGLQLGSIQFTGAGYQIFGNQITLADGISDTSNGDNTFDPDLIFSANQTFSKPGTGSFTMFGDLNMGLFGLTVDTTSTMSIPSNILGTNTSAAHIAVTKNGTGTLGLTGSGNNYLGQTRVNAGTLIIGSNSALGATQNTDIDRTVIASGSTLRIATTNYQSNEKFELSGAGVSGQGAIFSTSCVTCILHGDIEMLSATTINIGTNNSLSLNGNIFSGSTLTKTGAGTLVFNAGAINFVGTTVVNGGQIIVNGLQQNSPVSLNSGTVGGSGTIGALSGTGTVAPGTSAGILTVNGTANLSSTILNIELGGPTPGTQYDRLNVTGAANLGAGTSSLNGSTLNGFAPTVGQQFTIIQATGGVTGTFAQGNTITFGGTTFNITYNANSVVLTVVSAAPGVVVSGRVLASLNGRGVRGAVVTLTDPNGIPRNVHTGPNGVYRFEAVPTGVTYLVSVQSRRFDFEQRILQVFDEVAGFDLIALQ